MPTYAIVIGIYPTTPQTTAADFVANYLTGLTVTAYEVDFVSPNPVAALQPAGNEIGSASYPASIYQLQTLIGLTMQPAAAAAAVIDIPAAMASQFVDPAGDPYNHPSQSADQCRAQRGPGRGQHR